jgi:hypothetical protein
MAIDLTLFDKDYKPEAPKFLDAKKADELEDGEYTFLIHDVHEKFEGGYYIVELDLEVVEGAKHKGLCITHAIAFVDTAAKMRRLGHDLKKLGFDAENWTLEKGRQASVETRKAMDWLPGMRFKATKRSSTGKDKKTYHNVNIVARNGDDGIPKLIGEAELKNPPKREKPAEEKAETAPSSKEPDNPFGF